MNRFFSCKVKNKLSWTKYLIFSLVFVIACFLALGEKVGAANVDYPYKGNSESITQGNAVCSATGLSHGYIPYIVRSSNYKGTAAANCVNYSYTSKQKNNGAFNRYSKRIRLFKAERQHSNEKSA